MGGYMWGKAVHMTCHVIGGFAQLHAMAVGFKLMKWRVCVHKLSEHIIIPKLFYINFALAPAKQPLLLFHLHAIS